MGDGSILSWLRVTEVPHIFGAAKLEIGAMPKLQDIVTHLRAPMNEESLQDLLRLLEGRGESDNRETETRHEDRNRGSPDRRIADGRCTRATTTHDLSDDRISASRALRSARTAQSDLAAGILLVWL
jgi:hypothetical protein